jgi:hypothetical protein
MLVSGLVRERDGFVVIGGDRDPAMPAPSLSGNLGGRPVTEQLVDRVRDRDRQVFADRDRSSR